MLPNNKPTTAPTKPIKKTKIKELAKLTTTNIVAIFATFCVLKHAIRATYNIVEIALNAPEITKIGKK